MNPDNLIVVAAMYKFVNLPDCNELQTALLSLCQSQNIKGTILLAQEGINGTIAGSRQQIDAVLAFLRNDSRFADIEHKESYTEIPPFERLKIKLKPEIVTLGLPEVNPSEQVGTYVKPEDWNELISNPEVTVIDTRNDYEVTIGTFKGAENPQTQIFRDFPEYVQKHLDTNKHKKVAMFCTGGIRCEKASSYLLSQGFAEVYHLQGGILKYLEEIPPEESLWEGECFVFDERNTVNHDLEAGYHELCFCCGYPVSEKDKTSPEYEEGISCPHCFHSLTTEKRKRLQQKWQHYQSINSSNA
jgi:UPF0176 protein